MTMITFLGDVYLPGRYESDLRLSANYIINLESPITSSNRGCPHKVNLKTENNFVASVFGSKPIAVCLANNNIMDYGEEGYRDTIKSLEQSGIEYFGAGYRDSNCNNPKVIKVSGFFVALMGYVCQSTSPVFATDVAPGVMPIELEQIIKDIEKSKNAGVDRVIVSLHWGAEEVYLPTPKDVALAHKILDAGANMIVGHHSHCIQPCEIYKNKHIFYGLGNCVMPDLDVPANYIDGVPTRSFKKKGYSWNRKGLAVSYDVQRDQAAATLVQFDGKKISSTGKSYFKQRPLRRSADIYSKAFRLSFIFGKIRPFIANYMHNPRLPRLAHFNFIFSLIRSVMQTRTYK